MWLGAALLLAVLVLAAGLDARASLRRESAAARAKRLAPARRQRLIRLSHIVHGAHDAWWDLDLVNQTAYSSDRWRGMAGVGLAGTASGVGRRTIHPQDSEMMSQRLLASLADPACSVHVGQFRQVRRDGQEVPVEVSATIERDGQGIALRMRGATVRVHEAGLWQKLSDGARKHRETGAAGLVGAAPASRSMAPLRSN